MKKLITLVLVLVLAFGLSIPALAFTSDTSEEEDHPYDLKIYLVEYEDNDLFGFATLPPSDRGYAKNEIVAAVVELVVPEDENPNKDYGTFEFGGDNIDLNVTDNDSGKLQAVKVTSPDSFIINKDGDKMIREAGTVGLNPTKDTTYKWLFFAKVTGDDASLYAKLTDGSSFHTEAAFGEEDKGYLYITLDGVAYDIENTSTGSGDFQYIIDVCEGGDYEDAEIYIDVDEDNVSLGMSIDPAGSLPKLALGVNTKNELGIVVGATVETGEDAEDYLDIYNDIVVDVFGMDYFKIGNYVRDSFFEDLVSGDTIVATVDIAPWTAYVTVPDNIVVDPPKTGDAASIMGFMMVALSCAGTAMLKKRS